MAEASAGTELMVSESLFFLDWTLSAAAIIFTVAAGPAIYQENKHYPFESDPLIFQHIIKMV
jgi:hypothetical protein